MHAQRNPRLACIAASAIYLLAAAGVGAEPPSWTVGLAAYTETLRRVVTPGGDVHYAALKSSPNGLDTFLRSVATLEPTIYEMWSDADRIAFWINAYNAITLKTITDHYPIHASGLAALRFPHDSIRQIKGAWTDSRWTVMRRTMSLDAIEHDVLRKDYHEPRVHMALVCAARGCPPLRAEPYDGARLDEQLVDQARRYLASPAGLVLDGDTARVSAIFFWFGDDFARASGGEISPGEAVRAFLATYAPTEARRRLANGAARLARISYDWRLNDADGQ